MRVRAAVAVRRCGEWAVMMIFGSGEKMKILVISSGVSDDDYGIASLVAEAGRDGRSYVSSANISDFKIEGDQITIAGQEMVSMPDIVIPRPEYPNDVAMWASVLGYFEGRGITCVNNLDSIKRVNDKITMHGYLQEAGLPLPLTVPVDRLEDLPEFKRAVGWPLVLKQSRGGEGRGVQLCKNRKKLIEQIFKFLGKDPHNKLLAQQYIASSFGRDVRAFVIGDQVVAAMIRQATDPKEFRSNIGIGGKGTAYEMPLEWQQVAVRASRALGLEIAGVDLMFGEDGSPIVCEVNRTPGFKGLHRAHPQLNIPRLIIDHAVALDKAAMADLACRQRIEGAKRGVPLLTAG